MPATRRATGRRQRGQAATEYVLVAAIVAAALCLPWAGGEAPAVRLLAALAAALRSFDFWVSCC